MVQAGPHPVKLTGPSYVTSMVACRGALAQPRTIIYYEVTMDQTSSTDQTLTVAESGHLFLHPSTIIVPANTLTKRFSMTPFDYGDTILTVSNGSGSVSMDITVEP